MYDVIVIGGGAAGIFAAIAAKTKKPDAKVAVLEKTAVLLAKVRISGGGRCNVTHACFNPLLLTQNYPRGNKELIAPFHCFQPQDTIQWFESRGVPLKTEEDQRIFPISDESASIIQCLLTEAKKLNIEILLQQKIQKIEKKEIGFSIYCKEKKPLFCDSLILATGSNAQGYDWARDFGHIIQEPIPSLFTFHCPTSALKELSGISVEEVELKISQTNLAQKGPLLLTHFGFSGPAVIKLSAWGAKYFYEKKYQATLLINWLPQMHFEQILFVLSAFKKDFPRKKMRSENLFPIPLNLWKKHIELIGGSLEKSGREISQKDLYKLAEKLHADSYQIDGKTTHKEEFVTCGGVSLKEIHFKTLESKVCPRLFFAGEILDIDGLTGGFNFQNAWTTGFIAGCHSIKKIPD